MKWQIDKAPSGKLLIAGATVALFLTTGIGAVLAWAPDAADEEEKRAPDQTLEVPQAQSEVDMRVRARCAECGVVESTRMVVQRDDGMLYGSPGVATRNGRRELPTKATEAKKAKKAVTFAEVTLRMNDGESRRFIDANPDNWRPGERVIFIEGAGSER